MSRKRPYCLTIAGFDPSGGAGILADIKTFEQFRIQGLSVVTANTIQTEDAYMSTHWTAPEVVLEQLDTLLTRYPVTHVKIGLVENAEVLLRILESLHRHISKPFILWDPVLRPTVGGNLQENRFSEQLPAILQQVSMITPNLPEYELLCGNADPGTIARGHQVEVFLKGGHSDRKGTDFLYTGEKVFQFNAQISTPLEKHGTGCILSAALTSCRALRYPVVKGALKSKRYVERAILSNPTLLAWHRF